MVVPPEGEVLRVRGSQTPAAPAASRGRTTHGLREGRMRWSVVTRNWKEYIYAHKHSIYTSIYYIAKVRKGCFGVSGTYRINTY